MEIRLYVGRFAAPTKGDNEQGVRSWADSVIVGSGPIKIIGVTEVVNAVRKVASHKQYRDDPALVALKVLEAAGQLKEMPEAK